MSQEMMDKTCRGFAEALAAREPVPGGGSASAFVGALGASLCGMVARYGATNPALADRADDLTHAFAQADELAQELVGLVAEDVRAYGQVSAAYGISREDSARPAAIQDALHVAAMPPYRIMDACGRALALLEDMADKGSRQLLSDVACGAVFCRAAMQGASLTLFANTTSMKDRARAESLRLHVTSCSIRGCRAPTLWRAAPLTPPGRGDSHGRAAQRGSRCPRFDRGTRCSLRRSARARCCADAGHRACGRARGRPCPTSAVPPSAAKRLALRLVAFCSLPMFRRMSCWRLLRTSMPNPLFTDA